MIGREELRGVGGGDWEDVNSILNTCFLIYCSFKGIFVLKLSFKKNKQETNKPQMRLLLKISGGTFYQIHTDICAPPTELTE